MDITTSRQVKQAMARHGVIPVEKAGTIIRILFISMFFSLDITFLLGELKKRKRLRQFARVSEVPSAQSIYQFVSKFEESQFNQLISDILNSMCRQSPHKKFRKLIVDGSAITLDLNIFRRKFRKKDLLDRDFRWGFSFKQGRISRSEYAWIGISDGVSQILEDTTWDLNSHSWSSTQNYCHCAFCFILDRLMTLLSLKRSWTN